jgi:hypothetical protein
MSSSSSRPTAVAADPADGALDDPALRQHDERCLSQRRTISIFHVPVRATAAAIFGP